MGGGTLETDTLWDPAAEDFVREVAAVADAFRVDLCIPGQMTGGDRNSLNMLSGILRETAVPADAFSMRIAKSKENEELVSAAILRGVADLFCKFDRFQGSLFGVPIPVGAVKVRIDRATIKDVPGTSERWRSAFVGEAVEVVLGPDLAVFYSRALQEDE